MKPSIGFLIRRRHEQSLLVWKNRKLLRHEIEPQSEPIGEFPQDAPQRVPAPAEQKQQREKAQGRAYSKWTTGLINVTYCDDTK